MISITCTQCQTVLTIDDAFAGGVCRCQHCGTIQTVPSALKSTPTPQPFAGPSSTQSKTLYQNPATMGSGVQVAATGVRTSSGLDDLAQAVGASSGLSGSSLRGAYVAPAAATATATAPVETVAPPEAPAEPEAPVETPRKSPLIPILIGAAVLIIALLGVVIFLIVHQLPGGGTSGAGGTGGTVGGETFGGIAIAGSRVIYVLDDANSISNDFDPLRAATLQSLNSLGSDRKFAVILWNNNSDEFAFPKDGLAPANPSQIESFRTGIQDITATGQSQLRSSLQNALARNPDTIIIVTAKSSLEEDDQKALAGAQDSTGGKVKFYTFDIGTADDDPVMKMAAKATGGDYRHLSSQDLRSLTP